MLVGVCLGLLFSRPRENFRCFFCVHSGQVVLLAEACGFWFGCDLGNQKGWHLLTSHLSVFAAVFVLFFIWGHLAQEHTEQEVNIKEFLESDLH